jgi:hypothetical protein
VKLTPDPEMPPSLRNRAADNWTSLLSIADSFGYGETARAAATVLSADRLDEDVGVQLLIDVRTIFQAREIDRIGSAALVEQLIGLDEGHWGEWRGPNDDRPPCKLTQPQLAQLLRPFGINSRTIRPCDVGSAIKAAEATCVVNSAVPAGSMNLPSTPHAKSSVASAVVRRSH